mgnify:CR=1 FL=1
MTTKVNKNELKSLIKEGVKEVMEAELKELRALALPEVSEEEQKDIEERYGEPSYEMEC